MTVAVPPGSRTRRPLPIDALEHLEGWWPAEVPGAMFPTLGGCVAVNVHGKNHWRAGSLGEYLEEIDLLAADGRLHTLSRTHQPELFRAAVGGLGLLGFVTRIRLRL